MGDMTQVYEGVVIILGVVGVPLLAYIARKMQRFNIALFGLVGDNGLVNDVKELRGWRKSHELHHASMGEN